VTALLQKLQARAAARTDTEARRLAIGLPAEPPEPVTTDRPLPQTLLKRLQEKAGLPDSWRIEITPEGEERIAKVEGSHELDRVAALPRRPADWPNVPDLSPIYVHTPGPCNGGCKLCAGGPVVMKKVQSAILWEAVQENGAHAPVGVGHGKTLPTLLLHDAMRAKRTVLMIQPDLRDQLANDVELYGRHFVLPDVYFWDGEVREGSVCVLAYSTISSAKNQDVLDVIAPDLLVRDEAQNLRSKTSARTKRVERYTKDHPECRVVDLSGSMTTRSLNDAAHLAQSALHNRSPYPINHYPTLRAWCGALDAVHGDEAPIHPGALLEVLGTPEDKVSVAMGNMTPTEAARRAFGKRLAETPGVIATEDGGAGMNLVIRPRKVPPLPQEVRDAMGVVRGAWTTPDGEEALEDGAAIARVMKQLAAGFYYVWDWGPAGRDEEWLAARRNWHVELRQILSHSKRGMDSPLLVARAAERGDLDHLATLAWTDWKAVKGRFNPTPPTQAVWLSNWFVIDVENWMYGRTTLYQAGEQPGIVWYSHVPVGEALRARGAPVFAGGTDAAAILTAKDPVIVASIQAHGTGKNLQRYAYNLVTTPPANGTKWEQLLGRTHRPGQMADTVDFEVATHTPELLAAWRKAKEDARFQESTQRARQKLLMARLDPSLEDDA
jgi:hypothetical protein